jgi:hypothetical protein
MIAFHVAYPVRCGYRNLKLRDKGAQQAMKMYTTLIAGAAALLASTAAFAAPIDYDPNFTGATGLTYAGGGSLMGSSVQLTNVNTLTSGGAVYASNALAVDSGLNFTSDFTFNIGAEASGVAGNGFTFVLTSNPAALGTVSQNLGLGPTTGSNPGSVEIQFSTYANKTNNPTYAPGQYYSNMVAVSTDGNVVVPQSATSSYAAPYGVNACDNTTANKSSRAGCLANGDVWTAKITYMNGLLSVILTDPKEGMSTTVLSNYAINIASVLGSSLAYAGFTASNGAIGETTTIDSWDMSVPEPMSLAAFGVGLGALGLIRARRRAA